MKRIKPEKCKPLEKYLVNPFVGNFRRSNWYGDPPDTYYHHNGKEWLRLVPASYANCKTIGICNWYAKKTIYYRDTLQMGPFRENAIYITQEHLPVIFQIVTEEIEQHDRKLSPNRAKEIAAARILKAIHTMIAYIDDRVRKLKISEDEEIWYDSIYVYGWNPTRDLEKLSESRTILSDSDLPIINLPLSVILPPQSN